MTVSTRRRILQKLETLDAGELPQSLAALFELLDDEMRGCERRVHQILETEYQRQQQQRTP